MGSPADSITEPAGFAHPRAAPVIVLSTAGGLRAELLALGCVRLSAPRDTGLCACALNVDGQLVSFVARRGNARVLEEALSAVVPVDYEVRTWFDAGRVVAAFLRLDEAPGLMVDARCSRGGHTVHLERTNRFVLSNRARGAGSLRVTLNAETFEVQLTRGTTPLETAARLKALLAPRYSAQVSPLPSDDGDGDVQVTLSECTQH